MNRAQYMALRKALRKSKYRLASMTRHNEMADSRLCVQMDSHAEAVNQLRTRIQGIRQAMPQPTDPLGFGPMYRQWERDLLNALKAIRLRREYDQLACYRVRQQEMRMRNRLFALANAA